MRRDYAAGSHSSHPALQARRASSHLATVVFYRKQVPVLERSQILNGVGKLRLQPGDDAFASPEASRFQLDPSAVMSLTSNGSCGRRMHARSLPPEDSSELEPWALAA